MVLTYNDFYEKIKDIRKRSIDALEMLEVDDQRLTCELDDIENRTASLVLVGFSSTGKSSIAKMLTGDESIIIGEGVTTEDVKSYPWNGIVVTDTPGIKTGLRPEHDKLTYDAIADSDMLIYVISDSLFGNEGGVDFRKLAIDEQKADEMILVVNKMMRESNGDMPGNTPERQQIMINDIARVLSPLKPEDMYICFLDAKSYLDSVKEREFDPEEADALVEESGYNDFISVLNRFVDDKRYISQRTTELYKIDRVLENALKSFDSESETAGVVLLEEEQRRKKEALLDERNNLQDEIRSTCMTAATEIRSLGTQSAELLTEDSDLEQLGVTLNSNAQRAQNIRNNAKEKAKRIVERSEKITNFRISEIEDSALAEKAASCLKMEFETLPDGLKSLLNNSGPGLQNISKQIIGKAYKEGTQDVAKLQSYSGAPLHEGIKKAGHAFHIKFKPYQALKIARAFTYGAHALGAVGAITPIISQIKNDHDATQQRKNIKLARQSIRNLFNNDANDICHFAEQLIVEWVNPAFSEHLSEVNNNLLQISESKAIRSKAYREILAIRKDCHKLIKEIRSREVMTTV